jgi:hypothetical protein
VRTRSLVSDKISLIGRRLAVERFVLVITMAIKNNAVKEGILAEACGSWIEVGADMQRERMR